MPIEQIDIENFKSIKKTSLRLTQINIRIGANGAGKSNFISFFTFLKSVYEQNLQYYVATQGGANNILHFGSKYSRYLKGEIFFRKDKQEAPSNSYRFVLSPSIENELIFKEDSIGYNKNLHDKTLLSWDYRPITYPGKLESFFPVSQSYRSLYIKNYFESFHVYHFSDTGPHTPIRQQARIYDNKELKTDGGNLAAFLYKIQQNDPSSFSFIEHSIRSIAPFFLQFELYPDNLNPEYIDLKWREKGSEELFKAHHLSDGSIRFIALATLLLQPDPPKTLIIDEPELGLHPSALSKLIGMIKSTAERDVQIILSTQSPALISQFQPEDIIVVERKSLRNGKEESLFRRLKTSELNQWLDDFSLGELWEKNTFGGRP